MTARPIEAIKPMENSLAAQLQALDLLSARLSRLTDQTRWSARVPLNRKAMISGHIVHTNDLKVDVGGGYYVEMTAKEAAEYVQRRKNALLLQYAGLKENLTVSKNHRLELPLAAPSSVSLNPLFSMPTAAEPSRRPWENSTSVEELISQSRKGKEPESSPAQAETAAPAPTGLGSLAAGTGQEQAPQSLMDVVETFLGAQQGLSNMLDSQRDKLGENKADDALVTEEGLPIHEIREDFDGQLLGVAPQPTTNGEAVVEVDEGVDYWSAEAQARREALRRRIFSESDDSDLEADDNLTEEAKESPVQAEGRGRSEDLATSPALTPVRRSSSNAPAPTRSILKPPARKKSVSFDESVPLPPDSPPRETERIGFPLPQSEFEPRPVPVIATPTPATRPAPVETFAGFKRGFLSTSSSGVAPAHTSSPVPLEIPGKAKGPSKFAQVMAAKKQAQAAGSIPEEEPQVVAVGDEVKERVVSEPPSSAKPVKAEVTERTAPMAGLPKFSESKPMGSMKIAVVEREPPVQLGAGSPGAERETDTRGEAEESNDDHDHDDIDGYDDEEDEEEEDEDQYDLDEALLAREVALDYHRRQGYITKYTRDVDSDGEEQDPGTYEVNSDGELEGHGGVLMGLPRISADGQIINPTPDDIRKYVRVGRLENGNLVLAPGEEGWSSDEDAEKKARRDAVRRQLLGEEAQIPEPSPVPTIAPATASFSSSLPPRVETESGSSVKASKPVPGSIGEVKEREPSATATLMEPPQPKKVSRFKAARKGV